MSYLKKDKCKLANSTTYTIMLLKLLLCMFTIVGANAAYHRDIAQYAHSLTKLTPEGIDLSTARPKWRIHWVQSKRHRLWFSTKTCSCHPTKTHVNSMILILKLNLTSLSTTHILMYLFLNEVKFNLRIRITLFI